MSSPDGTTLFFRGVKMPSARGGESATVEFKAYAFNRDGLRSEPFLRSHETVSKEPGGRVVIIGIGIGTALPGSLSPPDDAERISRAVVKALALSEVERARVEVILLLSNRHDCKDCLLPTAENVRSVLASLDSAAAKGLGKPAGSAGVRPPGPDDTVILIFSGHGSFTGGEFSFPLDSGSGQISTEALTARELAQSLARVDAGELVLILEACYAAAAVEAEGFLPAPLNDHSLGQLAWDKQMRIIASSEATGLSYRHPRGGLLATALVDALGPGTAQRQEFDVGEWFSKAHDIAIELQEEILRTPSLGSTGPQELLVIKLQRPQLYDFYGLRRPKVFLQTKPEAPQ